MDMMRKMMAQMLKQQERYRMMKQAVPGGRRGFSPAGTLLSLQFFALSDNRGTEHFAGREIIAVTCRNDRRQSYYSKGDDHDAR